MRRAVGLAFLQRIAPPMRERRQPAERTERRRWLQLMFEFRTGAAPPRSTHYRTGADRLGPRRRPALVSSFSDCCLGFSWTNVRIKLLLEAENEQTRGKWEPTFSPAVARDLNAACLNHPGCRRKTASQVKVELEVSWRRRGRWRIPGKRPEKVWFE